MSKRKGEGPCVSPRFSVCGFDRIVRLKDHFAPDFAECAGGVRFVGVDVHRGLELRADADDDVAEGEGTTVRVDLHGDDLLVLDAEFLRVLGREVDVALRDDDAFGDIWGTDEDPNDLWGDN